MLAGNGPAALRRLRYLESGGAADLAIYSFNPDPELRQAAGSRLRERLPGDADISGSRLVFVAGLDEAASETIAIAARRHGVPVNVEDVIALCDFHVPAVVRRGDLILSVATGGKSPGLARMMRAYLEQRIGPEWEERLDLLARERARWYADGLGGPEVSKRTQDLIERNGWLS